jgi:hypothetical protein
MKNKSSKLGEHSWVCQQSGGILGEVLISKPLNIFTIQAILDNPDKAVQVCPLGEIVCVDCQSTLLQNKNADRSSIYSTYVVQLVKNNSFK